MGDRLAKILVVALLVVLGAYLAQPYLDRFFYSASTPRASSRAAACPRSSARRSNCSSASRPPWCRSSAAPARCEALPAEGENGAAQSGTGFVWDAAGHIVTNDHVVEGAGASRCGSPPARCCGRSIVGTAPNYDLAVLRVGRCADRCRRRLPIGTSDDLKVGQSVFAIGNPFGLDQIADHRHHQRAQAPAADQRRPRDRQRDPDRRRHQSRQFRRPAARLGRARDRRQHRHHLAVRDERRASASPSRSMSSTASFRRSSATATCRRPGSASSPPTRRRQRARASKAWSSCASVPGSSGRARRPARRRPDRRASSATSSSGGTASRCAGWRDLTDELERVGVGKRVDAGRCKRDGRETTVEVDVMDIGRRR